MSELNRRNFLKNLMFAGGAIALSRSGVFAADGDKSTVRPFEMLALGDSVVWGQGLKDNKKFTFLTQDWIEREIFRNNRFVNLQVKAHSGAVIQLDKKKKIVDALKYYNGEVDLGTPTILQQADDALNSYRQSPDPQNYYNSSAERLNFYRGNPVLPENVDLILVNGGINDFEAGRLVGISPINKKITKRAEDCCYNRMNGLLKKLSGHFPNARIVVTGYFPLISEQTNPNAISDSLVEIFGTNPFTDKVIKALKILASPGLDSLHVIRKYLAERSSIWYKESNKHLKNAVDKANRDYPLRLPTGAEAVRVFFARPIFEDDNAYDANKTFLWKLIDRSKTNDDRYDERQKICKEANINGTGLIICRRAGLFHPNKDGANAYFEAIKNELKEIYVKG